MLSYQEYEEKIFNWLLEKNKKDKSFTFSLRRKATKGAERDYFIGTQVSNYFSTTFWYIPIGFPGSSSDLIDLTFIFKEKGYGYYIFFNQTRNPDSQQNEKALRFIQSLKPKIKKEFTKFNENSSSGKMEYYEIISPKDEYEDINELFNDLNITLNVLISIIDKEINEFTSINPDFKAYRFTEEEFNSMLQKLENRKRKYAIKEIFLNNDITTEIVDIERKYPLNLILFGPPGTGKTYHTVNRALEIIECKSAEDINSEPRDFLRKRFENYVEKGQIVFTTFHQSMSYEDFIEGIKPYTNEDNRLNYDIEPGIFKIISDKAKDNWLDINKEDQNFQSFEVAFNRLKEEWIENSEMKIPLKRDGYEYEIIDFTKSSIKFKKASGGTGHTLSISTLRDYYYGKKKVRETGVGIYYPGLLNKLKTYKSEENKEVKENKFVLIIDEINRGNISQIFGELITLIEEDKRLGNDEAFEIVLPYSNESFGVPPNLYIIGTMNTADRSVEALDTALRRRFFFEEIIPDPNLIINGILESTEGKIGDIDIPNLLITMNNRIEKLLDKDHQIGHSYFMSIGDLDGLKVVYYNKIIPLLQEYFYGDYGKIGLVLGKGLVNKKEWNVQSNSFAEFDYESSNEFDERDVYEIIDYRKNRPVMRVKNKDVEMTFEKAIKLLLNQEVE